MISRFGNTFLTFTDILLTCQWTNKVNVCELYEKSEWRHWTFKNGYGFETYSVFGNFSLKGTIRIPRNFTVSKKSFIKVEEGHFNSFVHVMLSPKCLKTSFRPVDLNKIPVNFMLKQHTAGLVKNGSVEILWSYALYGKEGKLSNLHFIQSKSS